MLAYTLFIMSRVIIALGLVVVVASTVRADSPTFAIDLWAKDFRVVESITTEMERDLRALGSVNGARYRSVGTRKDRVAASTDSCPTAWTSTACAAEIGKRLGVDYLLAGEIEIRGTSYLITLNVVNVGLGKRVRSLRDRMTVRTASSKKWSKRVWQRLIDDATGSFVITCNAQRAQIFIDKQLATELYGGGATVSGLGMGTHVVEVRADGYKPYVGDADVDGDTPLNILLVKSP